MATCHNCGGAHHIQRCGEIALSLGIGPRPSLPYTCPACGDPTDQASYCQACLKLAHARYDVFQAGDPTAHDDYAECAACGDLHTRASTDPLPLICPACQEAGETRVIPTWRMSSVEVA